MFEQKIYLFISVAETGSFSAAAKIHYISQSAVSQAINKLEEELGYKLLDRSGYRPTLTKAGKYYYEAVSKLSNEYNTVVKNAKNISYNESKLVVGITNDFEKKQLLKIIQSFQLNYHVKVSIKRCSPFELLQLLKSKKVDIALGMKIDFDEESDIISEQLYQFHTCIICSNNHPLASKSVVKISDIKHEPVVLLNTFITPKTYSLFMDGFKKDGFIPNVVKQCDDIDDFIMSISYNEGIGYTVKELVEGEDQISILDLVESKHQSTMAIAHNRNDERIQVQKLIEIIKNQFDLISKDYK